MRKMRAVDGMHTYNTAHPYMVYSSLYTRGQGVQGIDKLYHIRVLISYIISGY